MDPLLDLAPCGFLVVADDGHVVLANRTALEMLGAASAEQLVGRHVDALLSTASRIFYQTHIFPTLKLQGQAHEIYVSMLRMDRGELPVLLNARRRNEGDRTVNDWAIVPMRQRNELENEILKARKIAEDSARAKEQFLGLVTHELRSPLGAIRNWAAILAQKGGDPAILQRGTEAIERNAQMQAALIEDILDEVRVATGKLHLDMDEIDARSIMEAVLEGAASTAAAKSITLERDIGHDPLRVRADRTRLQQVFWNIVTNALKFTPNGGRVRAELRCVDDWIEAVITDNGRGISPEFLPHVFEHFRQEEGGAAGGLGLGMAITRKLVELHGGSIAASSEGIGKGATFTVRLPSATPCMRSAGALEASRAPN